MPIMSFAAALEDAGEHRHALLGNGFSIACRSNIFTYGSLLERADFRDVPYARRLFETLGTTDFEVVIQTLVQASRVTSVYPHADPSLISQLARDADALKTVLVKAIAQNHPDLHNEIDNEEYRRCRAFLSNFKHIYTLNYDLLLYWALMHNDEGEWIDVMMASEIRSMNLVRTMSRGKSITALTFTTYMARFICSMRDINLESIHGREPIFR
jgi:hypothetical protein